MANKKNRNISLLLVWKGAIQIATWRSRLRFIQQIGILHEEYLHKPLSAVRVLQFSRLRFGGNIMKYVQYFGGKL